MATIRFVRALYLYNKKDSVWIYQTDGSRDPAGEYDLRDAQYQDPTTFASPLKAIWLVNPPPRQLIQIEWNHKQPNFER